MRKSRTKRSQKPHTQKRRMGHPQKLERDKRKTLTFDPEKSKSQVEKRYLGHPAVNFA